MKQVLGSWILLTAAWTAQAAGSPENNSKYGFATKDYSIEVKVAYFEPYKGSRLAFFTDANPGRQICFSGDGAGNRCVEHFVGALAVVTYSVRLAGGGRPASASIREAVTVSAQSPGLPRRESVSITQKLVNGMATDIQAFGYDDTTLGKADRSWSRNQAQRILWRLCTQELYINKDTRPFAIIEWKHQLDRISIMRIYAPADGK
jgi:hypothetical protein